MQQGLHFNVGHPDSHILELVVFPSISGPFDHSESSIVLKWASVDDDPPIVIQTYKFIILNVQQDEFWPQMSLLSSLDDFRDVDTSYEELQVFHHWWEISSLSPKI